MASSTSSNDIGGGTVTTIGFPQAGQVDWVGFGNTVYSASLAVMDRLAKAGIQPLTHGAGLALASQFRLGPTGRRRMDEALGSLTSVPAFDKALYFGFGVQSFVRLLGETQRGINCIALCSSLSEVFSEPFAARTLSALWRVCNGPAEYEPSYAQFLALVKGCSGVLAKSTFSQTAGLMLGSQTNIDDLAAPPPEQLASVLGGLFKISQGEVESIAVEGGAACAFVAGLAQWLFNFKIHVEDKDHRTIFLSTTDPNTAQVSVRYSSPSKPDHRSITGRTTYLLHPSENLFLYNEEEMMNSFTFRVSWDRCLLQTFSATIVEQITAHQDVVGHIFGSLARFLDAKAHHESEWIQEARRFARAITTPGYHLVGSVTTTFPELAAMGDLKSSMLQGLSQGAAEALHAIRIDLRLLKSICLCISCGGKLEKSICLPVTVYTIFELVRLFAHINNDAKIPPTLFGITWICSEYHNKKIGADDKLEFLHGNQPIDRLDVEDLLQLFSSYKLGTTKMVGRFARTAMAGSGDMVPGDMTLSQILLVVEIDWLGDFEGPSTTQAASYKELRASNVFRDDRVTAFESPFERPEKPEVKTVFYEDSRGGVVFYYQLVDPSCSFSGNISPGLITMWTSYDLGKARCECPSRTMQQKLPFPDDCVFVTGGWLYPTEETEARWGRTHRRENHQSEESGDEATEIPKKQIIIWPKQDGWSRSLVLMDQKPTVSLEHNIVYVRRKECIACSIHSAHDRFTRWYEGQDEGKVLQIHIL